MADEVWPPLLLDLVEDEPDLPPPLVLLPVLPPPWPVGVPPVEALLVPLAGWELPLLRPEPLVLLPDVPPVEPETLLLMSLALPPPVPAPVPALLLGELLRVSSRLS